MTTWPLEVDPVFGCATWTGKLDREGYGVAYKPGVSRHAHRAVYEERCGAIGDGLVLDHACRNRACCAVAHLEPVSASENERRKSWRYRAGMKRCKQGHDLKMQAMVTPQGGRVCRQCSKEA